MDDPEVSARPGMAELAAQASRRHPLPEPFERAEVEAAFANPLKVVDVVLASPQRIALNVERSHALGPLALLLLLTAAIFALPFGFVLGMDAWWRVAVLYLGSTLICLPSLYVFSSYLGFSTSFTRIAALALLIPSVAAIFTAGFAPILGFLRATFDSGSTQIRWQHIGSVLLWIALAAGLVQLWRCLRRPSLDAYLVLYVLLWTAWHVVFLYVLIRMSHVLGLGQ